MLSLRPPRLEVDFAFDDFSFVFSGFFLSAPSASFLGSVPVEGDGFEDGGGSADEDVFSADDVSEDGTGAGGKTGGGST